MRGLVDIAKDPSGVMSSPPVCGSGEFLGKVGAASPHGLLKNFYSICDSIAINELRERKRSVTRACSCSRAIPVVAELAHFTAREALRTARRGDFARRSDVLASPLSTRAAGMKSPLPSSL